MANELTQNAAKSTVVGERSRARVARPMRR
jgi:hypothetical protein